MSEIVIVDPAVPYCHQRLCEDIARLSDAFSDVMGVADVGYSESGRSIPVVSLGYGSKKLLAVGCIHGREYVSASFLMKTAEEYARAYCQGHKDYVNLLREWCFHIVPVSNPDSVEIALLRDYPRVLPTVNREEFKNNTDNINLNANFPYKWEYVPPERQGGRYPSSARETRFLIKLCCENLYEKMLSFHCRGDCIYWQDRGSKRVSGDKETAENLNKLCGYSLCPPTLTARDYSGGFENWFRNAFARVGICVELVSDENVSYRDMCRHFEHYTRWRDTRHTLRVATMSEKYKC